MKRLFLDANILFKFHPRTLLMRLAGAGVVELRWSSRVLDEVTCAFKRTGNTGPTVAEPSFFAGYGAHTEALVAGYEPLMKGLQLKDPADVHVLAAALHSKVDFLVTENRRDFRKRPQDALTVCGPDDLFFTLFRDHPSQMRRCVEEILAERTEPPQDLAAYLNALRRNRLFRFAKALTANPHP